MLHDHDVIRTIVCDLRMLLKDGAVPIGLCFASRRWALTRELLRHFASEREFFRRRGVAERIAAQPGIASAEALEGRYRDHIARWTPGEIDRRWPEYCRELRGLLIALENRMAYEERAIYPAIESAA